MNEIKRVIFMLCTSTMLLACIIFVFFWIRYEFQWNNLLVLIITAIGFLSWTWLIAILYACPVDSILIVGNDWWFISVKYLYHSFYFKFISGAFLVAILASPIVFVMRLLQLPKIYSLIAGEIFANIGYSYWLCFWSLVRNFLMLRNLLHYVTPTQQVYFISYPLNPSIPLLIEYLFLLHHI